MVDIINNDITNNVFSEKASVRPVFKKKKKREKLENYRPVSTLNCFLSIYEKFPLQKFKPFF